MYARAPAILAPERDLVMPDEVSILAAGTDTGAGAVWPSANLAIYLPYFRSYDAVVTAMRFNCTAGTAAGRNYDLGIHAADASGNPGAKLVSSGAVLTAAGVNTWTLTTPYTIPAGDCVYIGMSLSNATLAVWRWTQPSVIQMRLSGFAQEATAHPLPATATGVATANAYIPMIVLSLAAA